VARDRNVGSIIIGGSIIIIGLRDMAGFMSSLRGSIVQKPPRLAGDVDVNP
jgi:hypothetical protein